MKLSGSFLSYSHYRPVRMHTYLKLYFYCLVQGEEHCDSGLIVPLLLLFIR